MSAGADRWIRSTTTRCVALLALIAGTVSYLHMRTLVELHGQPGWVAALTVLSVLTRADRLVTCFEPLEDVAGGVGEVGVKSEALAVDLNGR